MIYAKAKQGLLKYFKKLKVDTNEYNYILQGATKKSITNILVSGKLSFLDYLKVKKVVYKRHKHEPLNYILKSQNFYGFDFYVNKNVLAPRPETEILVHKTLTFLDEGDEVLDLCTGSGCIGISLFKAMEKLDKQIIVDASDISSKALKVAKKNAKRLDCNISFIKSDLFSTIGKKYDCITCNPPYIKIEDKESLQKEVLKYDPHIALFGGESGLEFYEKIIDKAKNHLKNEGIIIFEIGLGQENDVSSLLLNKGFKTEVIKDFNGINRIVIGCLKY